MANDTPTYIYKPTWVANTFLLKGREERIGIDPLKIQKLVYNLHGWHLAVTGQPVVGERFEPWPKGPVLASLYHKFKDYRFEFIRELVKDIDPTTGEPEATVIPPSDEQFHEIFRAVWERYKGFTGTQLSALTHAPGTPWSLARDAGVQYISDESIKDHFVALGRQAA